MYIFVRFAAILTLILAVSLMLAGLGIFIYGLAQNAALTAWLNAALLTGSPFRLADSRFWASLAGLGIFLSGVGLAAQGQLMLVFVDIATNSRETNQILRSFRPREPQA